MHTRAGEIMGVSRDVTLNFVAVPNVLSSAEVAVPRPTT